MLLQTLFFFAIAICTTTAAAVIPGVSRFHIWFGLPTGLIAVAVAWGVLVLVTGDSGGADVLALIGLGISFLLWVWLRRWSWIAAQVLGMVVLSALAYLAYAVELTATENLGPLGLGASGALLVLEVAALTLSIYYVFEMLDVLGSRDAALPTPDRQYLPPVALQVPTYNEPVEVVSRTLEALARLDYPDLLVQVVDNNTSDPALWRPLEELCARLGPRFVFLHLENWPGYKAGALNEATRRLPTGIQVLGVIDSDYSVDAHWLREVVGHFSRPEVAFVQTPQDYRDWEDDRYLRALYYSYRYFFALSMPARAHRNAIIFAGTMGLIRRSALEAIGGWEESCITEDAEASLRLLGSGLEGVYVPVASGKGMMPLSFDGLKKQRFRWALGGIQILRRRWRDMIGVGDLRLTRGQRLHYLFGSLHWFGDLLQVFFTLLLVATAVSVAMHHQLPIRRVTTSVLLIPMALLATGLARALWALKTSTRCRWGDAFGAMRIWFALSWVTALACVRGLLRYRTAFLRTAKSGGDGSSRLRALSSSKMECAIAAIAVLAALAMLIRSPSVTSLVLAVLVLWQGALYSNALLVSMAAEGVSLTPSRRQYLRSPQTTGERAAAVGRAATLPAAAALMALAVLVFALVSRSGTGEAPFTGPRTGLGPGAGPGPATLSVPPIPHPQPPKPTAPGTHPGGPTPMPGGRSTATPGSGGATPTPRSTFTPTPVPTSTAPPRATPTPTP